MAANPCAAGKVGVLKAAMASTPNGGKGRVFVADRCVYFAQGHQTLRRLLRLPWVTCTLSASFLFDSLFGTVNSARTVLAAGAHPLFALKGLCGVPTPALDVPGWSKSNAASRAAHEGSAR